MGNMMNVIDSGLVQLGKLGIKTIAYFAPKKFEHLEEKHNCLHFEVSEH